MRISKNSMLTDASKHRQRHDSEQPCFWIKQLKLESSSSTTTPLGKTGIPLKNDQEIYLIWPVKHL